MSVKVKVAQNTEYNTLYLDVGRVVCAALCYSTYTVFCIWQLQDERLLTLAAVEDTACILTVSIFVSDDNHKEH